MILSMQGITKSFSGVTVLKDVSLDLEPGRVHAIIGENGAGKSTLMKIMTGVYTKDSGIVNYKGENIENITPRKSKEMGISIVHQELSLISSLSVMENIYLGSENTKSLGLIDFATMKKNAQVILDDLHVEFSPETIVSELTVANKQIVEIAKALSLNADVVVLDEPTSSLTQKETANLFRIINKLKEQNKAIVYISHHMEEIFEITDDLTILRDGECVHCCETKDISEDEIIRYMVGRELKNLDIHLNSEFGETVIDVKNLSDRHKVKDNSFTIREGEILGFAGLIGAGRTELAKTIIGLSDHYDGEIEFLGKPVHIKNTTHSSNLGIAYIPEDRRKEALLLQTEIYKNITLKYIDSNFLIDGKDETKVSEEMSTALKVKSTGIHQPVRELSGGNQQKVILARALLQKPKLLILDEPTRGIDVNAKAEIYQIIRDLANSGVAIMLISSEMSEILTLTHRVAVMSGGTIVKELETKDTNQEEIMYYAVGGK